MSARQAAALSAAKISPSAARQSSILSTASPPFADHPRHVGGRHGA
ncbi:MAG: hypothetical protein ACREHE_04215 [Rhizomicrobium sp.]